jgi:hypothetical protein
VVNFVTSGKDNGIDSNNEDRSTLGEKTTTVTVLSNRRMYICLAEAEGGKKGDGKGKRHRHVLHDAVAAAASSAFPVSFIKKHEVYCASFWKISFKIQSMDVMWGLSNGK